MDDRGSGRISFERVLAQQRIRTVFQPVRHLGSGAVVGYEALVRGIEGSGFDSADSLVAAAYRSDRIVEFDWLTRASACRAALAGGVSPDQLLFLNIEPIALDSDCPRDLWPDIERAFQTFQVVLEVTERSLDRDPGVLLDGIESRRRQVTGIALDDVGADATTVTMLPLVAPSIVKMDRTVIQSGPSAEALQVIDIVREEAERTGATVLAEGIEMAAQEELARSLGADLGQGYYLGEPATLSQQDQRGDGHVQIGAGAPIVIDTPFAAHGGRLTRRADASLIARLGQRIGSCGVELAHPAVYICLLPGPEYYAETDRARLARMVDRGVLTAVLGPGLPSEPGEGIRGIGLRHEPPIANEWAVIALGPCSSGALLARAVPEDHGVWEYAITHDKQRVIAAARCLFRRLGAPGPQWTR
jgi:EAL domain-containing protein (putative c-di-GMP-specific phosphodiesterase class I)